MTYRYVPPHPLLADYLRTVIVLEGKQVADSNKLPLFTNGIPALLCRTENDANGYENILQLTLFGKSTPAGAWAIGTNMTLIAYFFKPFALPALFSIGAAVLAKKRYRPRCMERSYN